MEIHLMESIDTMVKEIAESIGAVATALEERNEILRSQQEQKTKKTRKRKDSRDELYTPQFMACWEVYPNTLGKQTAAQQYKECVKGIHEHGLHLTHGYEDAHDLLLAKCKLFGEAWPKDRLEHSRQFCPRMSTFLYQNRWEENPLDWQQSPQTAAYFQDVQGPQWEE